MGTLMIIYTISAHACWLQFLNVSQGNAAYDTGCAVGPLLYEVVPSLSLCQVEGKGLPQGCFNLPSHAISPANLSYSAPWLGGACHATPAKTACKPAEAGGIGCECMGLIIASRGYLRQERSLRQGR